MPTCISCGLEHENKIKGDVFQLYLQKANEVILRNFKKVVDIETILSPICDACVTDFRKFMHYKMPEIAAEFAISILSDRKRSQQTIDGLKRARLRGVLLGRRPKITQEMRDQIIKLRLDGFSYRRIEVEVQLSMGSIARIWNDYKQCELQKS